MILVDDLPQKRNSVLGTNRFTLYFLSMMAARESIPHLKSVLFEFLNNTDYPRRIIIREVFDEGPSFPLFSEFFSNNDSADIFIVQTTIRRYFHYERSQLFIYGTKDKTSGKTG